MNIRYKIGFKYIVLISGCIFSYSCYAQSLSILQELEIGISAFLGTDYHRGYLGAGPVDERTQKMAHDIMITCGLDPLAIKILYLSNEGVQLFGVENLIALRFTILIDRNWFEQLTMAEQRFLLAHEIAHIKNKDFIAGGVAAGIAVYGFLKQLLRTILQEKSVSSVILPTVGALLILPSFFRMQEARADIDGARFLGTTQGGLQLMKRWIDQKRGYKPASTIGQFYYDLFATHPSHEKRLQQLEKLG